MVATCDVCHCTNGHANHCPHYWKQSRGKGEEFICPQCGHGVSSDEFGCCGLCGSDLVTPEVVRVIATERTREIVERLRGPGCAIEDGTEVHEDYASCELCEGIADWLEHEYLDDKEESP